jgi:hypothetical protein
MKLAIERHRFAPELNKVFFLNKQGEVIARRHAPGVTCIRQWREKFKPATPTRIAIVTSQYAEPSLRWLDKKRTGRINSLSDALQAKREMRSKVLPDAEVKVSCKTKLVWI